MIRVNPVTLSVYKMAINILTILQHLLQDFLKSRDNCGNAKCSRFKNFRLPGHKNFLKQKQFSDIRIFQLNINFLQFAVFLKFLFLLRNFLGIFTAVKIKIACSQYFEVTERTNQQCDLFKLFSEK